MGRSGGWIEGRNGERPRGLRVMFSQVLRAEVWHTKKSLFFQVIGKERLSGNTVLLVDNLQ